MTVSICPPPAMPRVTLDQHGCLVMVVERTAIVVPPEKVAMFVALVNRQASPNIDLGGSRG